MKILKRQWEKKVWSGNAEVNRSIKKRSRYHALPSSTAFGRQIIYHDLPIAHDVNIRRNAFAVIPSPCGFWPLTCGFWGHMTVISFGPLSFARAANEQKQSLVQGLKGSPRFCFERVELGTSIGEQKKFRNRPSSCPYFFNRSSDRKERIGLSMTAFVLY